MRRGCVCMGIEADVMSKLAMRFEHDNCSCEW